MQQMPPPPPELMVVLPVFNEEASIERVVHDWIAALDAHARDFVLLAIDDGSRDATAAILDRLAGEIGSRMETRSRSNRGHGQTCLEGYREAQARGIPFVLQIDSDGQCDPCHFPDFWRVRENHDVIYGRRTRHDGFRRIIASLVLKSMLLLVFRTRCVDPNVPYRLMRTGSCGRWFDSIPEDFFLANVALAVLLRRDPGIREAAVPIRFRERHGGEPSVPLSRFACKALELIGQLRKLQRGNPIPRS